MSVQPVLYKFMTGIWIYEPIRTLMANVLLEDLGVLFVIK